MQTPLDWSAADKAYQLHHAGCAICRAAGANLTPQPRCPEGAQLWATYQEAGDPPHFTWLARERKFHERRQQLQTSR